MRKLRIDLYSEITCPWCIIGQHRLDKVLAERFPTISADIVHHPVILVPDCPPAGVRIADLLKSRYGIADPTQAWARPEAEARASGLDLDLGRQPFNYATEGAHTLIRLARPLGIQHRLSVAISGAYFLEGRNTSNPEVLAEIAAAYGFDREDAKHLVQDATELATTRQEAAKVAALGVRTVPHFVFSGHVALNGGRSEEELAAAIELAMSSAIATAAL